MPETMLEPYRRMFVIRESERAIQAHYHEDDMKTPMHMSMGEEHIPVGVCAALAPGDQALGTYRSHGLYLAKTDDVDGFFAELYGKVTGMARGKAGSMHLCAPEQGLLCCSAVVASTIPTALGAAFANTSRGDGRRVAVFFGDGAVDEGVFWECINFACIHRLPLLFVCEDNGLAVHTGPSARHGFASLDGIIRQYNCHVFSENTTEVVRVRDLAQQALAAMANDPKPAFLHLHWYRYLEHVGVNEDFKDGYRPRADYERWLARDPLRLERERLLSAGIREADLAALETQERERITRAVAAAKAAPFADVAELHEGVFGCA